MIIIMNKKAIYIIDAKRTAIGNFCGALASIAPQILTGELIKNILRNNPHLQDHINKVIIGQVLTTGLGQNPARQAAINGGLNFNVPAYLINYLCGSGLKSIIAATQELNENENYELIIAGGQENMSMSPHFLNLRHAQKLGNTTLTDSLLLDGLTDAFHNYHMGITAENLAKKYNITREEQDNYACNSQLKAFTACQSGRFKNEIAPIYLKNDIFFEKDEFIKHDSSIEKLKKLKPVFDKENGTVTAGNSSGINDAAAVILIAKEEAVKKYNLQPMAQIISYAENAIEPELMGIGPVGAIKKSLEKANWNLADLELIELNEAFAAQVLAVNKLMNWNEKILNVNGGAIALGHPIGASGSRCLVSLLYEMQKRKAKKGLVSLCVGGGMGIALCVENLI